MPCEPYDSAAAALLAEEAGRLPDLSPCTVLLPNLPAATPFLAALRRQVEAPVFLPPRLATLRSLADGLPGGEGAEADSLRLAELRDTLRHTGLFAERVLWTAAEELLQFLDELSAAHVVPADDPAALLRQVRAAYGGRLARPLEQEGRLILELWQAMQQGGRRDPAADYARRLARAAAAAPGPLHTLGLAGLSRMEAAFLAQWTARFPVHALPCPPADLPRQACLEAAWTNNGTALRERAQALARRQPASPLLPGVRLYGSGSLEDEALATAGQVRNWIGQGLRQIAIVALDRLAARRLRALLERDRILVRDETGWTFSTASVAHVLDRLFALVQDDCYYQDLLDLLKSPFVFADLDLGARQRAVAALEQAIRDAGVVQGWSRFERLAGESARSALPLLLRLRQARERFSPRRLRLPEWQTALLAALDDLGAQAAFAGDAAGGQLLRLLERLGREAVGHATRYTFRDWREWLGLQLEGATFLDEGIDSPVRLVSLPATRLRPFEAAVVLGADADRLPPGPGGGLFNDRVRRELGLSGLAERQAELRQALGELICQAPHLLLTWQAEVQGEPNPPSPWLEVLEGLHRLAWGSTLRGPGGARSAAPPAADVLPARSPTPRPGRLPERLSASAWQSLVACPYQYFARHTLRLADLEDVPEEMEKRDYGESLHRILQRFHSRHPILADDDRGALLQDLLVIGDEVFAAQRERNYLALAWQIRWEGHAAAYLDWALAREAQGYRWQEAEVRFSRALDLADGRQILLHGRLDRVDSGPQGDAVLDYKAKDRQGLRTRLKNPGEDVQLAFYGLLSGAQEAAFVALDDERIDSLSPPGELPALARDEETRIRAAFEEIAGGAALPAQGARTTCQYCEIRGLCRRDWWDRP